ncbi:N-acetylneuraminate lyase [Saccharicrinis carchari]|uniref:N-acetylneuraminate lyase n=1 Tax=Saccharicrinis carchari TaxID=1168039 RepID=A0A521ENS7_SACCC|nr:dihydrodipicolinate synthase family protein [Saccharicrinis carchari]SMO85555.1 N-acetylneuraminate lyase [Saccharicrinis carchari]
MKKMEGLIAAPFAPMQADGKLNIDKIPAYFQFLQKNGITGAFINGSTGEGVSLSHDEKVKITAAWTAQNKDKALKVINLVGGTSYEESIASAVSSAELGVDAISILAPYYFKPASGKQLAEFCAKIAEAVPQLPVYFYHIPVLTGCNVSMYEFLQAADSMIPNLAGIKYTHEDFMDFLSCMSYREGKYDMLWGRDENLLPALVLGARGGVGSTFNYAAPLYHQLIKAYDKGNFAEARQLQQQSIDMIRLLGKYGGIATGKAYMRYVGMECGEFRSPVQNMTKEAYKAFEADVRALNMEALFSKI